MLADLWHAQHARLLDHGLSEAAMLGGLAMKWRWRQRREGEGKPNLNAATRIHRRVPTLVLAFTLRYEPLAAIAHTLDELRRSVGSTSPIHVDGASGAFIHPT